MPRSPLLRLAVVVAAVALLSLPSTAAAADARLKRIGTFRAPTYITGAPGDTDRLFVVERAGRIIVVRRGKRLSTPFLDISSRVSRSGERGLLSLAFAPDYESSRLFYVFFTDGKGDIKIEEFRASSADRADRSSRRGLIRQRHRSHANHNGGPLAFGPDGMLYAGLGDGGGANDPLRSGQDLGTLLGKVIRIDPTRSATRPYTIPPDNPFVGQPGARPEVYAYGLRNPFRLSFDRATGDIAIGDVGQGAIEEIDFSRNGGARGANYGWSIFEGSRRVRSGSAPGHVLPVLQRSHSSGWCAIIGGYVVRDPTLPALAGRYVYGDFCRRGLRSVVLSENGASGDRSLGVSVSGLSSFGEDAAGHVYAVSLGGRVYRLARP